MRNKVFNTLRGRKFHYSSGSYARVVQKRKEENKTPYCRTWKTQSPSVNDLKGHIRSRVKAAKRKKSGNLCN